MKIGIVGAGAIGCYYGARMVRAGREVHFLMRSDLALVRERGLRVSTPRETFSVTPVSAHATTGEMGPCDVVVIALKATANAALEHLLPPLLHARTALLTLQNGLGSDEWLAEKFGAERVLGGLCFICVNRIAPGEILCQETGSIGLAEFGRPADARAHAIAALFREAGIDCRVSDHLAELRWKKLVWNVPFNGLAIAAGGVTTDRILADPALEAEVRALMAEVIGAAARFGHVIPLTFIEQQIASTRKMGAYKPSSLIDYLAGREVEVEVIWGEPLRRAQAAGVNTPRLAALYQQILDRLARRR